MSAPPLDEALLSEALWAVEEYGSINEAARKLGLARTTLQSRYYLALKAREAGSFRGELDDKLADGFELKGYSQLTKTITGDPIWLKTRRAERDYWQGVNDTIKSTAAAAVINVPPLAELPQDDIIPWLQIGDAHIGMLACEEETGADFDIAIAEREICAAAAGLIDACPPCSRLVVNDLGDGTHYETFAAVTEASGNALDYDTRYWKMIRAYIRITRFIIERALEKAQVVDYIANQGNHSRSNDIWIAALVSELYEGTDRVNVIRNENAFIAYRMGKTLVMIHHGDKAKPEKCRNVMASDYERDWGETTFRYIDGGHVHTSQRIELAGCMFESWNNLAKRDKYAHDHGWRSRQCMTLVMRSRTYGEVGRQVMPIERVYDLIADKAHYRPPEIRAVTV